MRVLYVALTRAKEKLIITGFIKKDKIDKIMENTEKYEDLNIMLLQKAKSYLEWLILINSYNEKEINKISTWNFYKKEDILEMSKNESSKEEENISKEIIKKLEEFPIDEKIEEQIAKKLNYQYPYIESTTIPTKTSVTEIKQMSLESIENQNKILEDTQNEEELPKPKFLQADEETKISNAEKGTLIHLCMQKLDVKKQEYNITEIKELVDKLVSQKIITQPEADSINLRKIVQFTKSEIWKELNKANIVEREQPFYINILAKDIYNKNVDEKILVQGIIDLYYINTKGELVLVDFKTDYVSNNEENSLIDKYKIQLDLYKKALESSTGKKVDKTYIYSTYLEKEIIV